MNLTAESISRRYFRKTGEANFFEAVKPMSLALTSGSLYVLVGRSGSGKTTLLHMLAGLLTPSEGKIFLDGTDLYSLSDRKLSRLRNDKIAVIPQGRSSVDTLTILENILLPSGLYKNNDRTEPARQWMETLGISHLENARPAECSGGELRRMAIARAMTSDSEIILADEPTGDLDDENTALVLALFRKAADSGKTVFLVTHEMDALQFADFAWRMDGGQLTPYDERVKR